MAIYVGTVTIRRRDNSIQVTVEHIVVVGREMDDMKRNPDNLVRALRYMGGNRSRVSGEDPMRWVIIEVIVHKKLSE